MTEEYVYTAVTEFPQLTIEIANKLNISEHLARQRLEVLLQRGLVLRDVRKGRRGRGAYLWKKPRAPPAPTDADLTPDLFQNEER